MESKVILQLFFAIKAVRRRLPGNEQIHKLLSAMSMIANERIVLHIDFIIYFINSFGHHNRVDNRSYTVIHLANETALVRPEHLIERLEGSSIDFDLYQVRDLQLWAGEVSV